MVALVALVFKEIIMQKKIEERHKEITHIQNTIWSIYKGYLADHDMKKWNVGVEKLVKEYIDKGDQNLLNFARCTVITWCPVIEWFAEEFRNSPD